MAEQRRQISIRLSDDVYRIVADEADRQLRSVGAQIAYIVQLWTAQQRAQ